jgi:DNA mismatch endonuclease (patch repair protein)
MPDTRPEFWIPKLQRNRERDMDNARRLRAQGWRVLIVWECELRKPDQLSRRLAKAFSVPH